MRKLKIAGASVNQTPLDWDNNISNILQALADARQNNIDILCLPELCITGYGCEDLFLSEWLHEKAVQKLLSLLPSTLGLTVAIGIPVKFGKNLYNCACMIEDGKILGFTAKQFLANDGVHYEHRWFKPWKSGLIEKIKINNNEYPMGDVTYQLKGINIAFEICEDAWQKELRPGYQHCKKLNKLDLILNPSASHFSFGKTKLRENQLVLEGSEKFNCTYLFADRKSVV